MTVGAANRGNSGPSGAMVGRLADRIFTNEAPKPTPGSAPIPNPPPPPATAEPADWLTTLITKRAPTVKIGERFTFECPANPGQKQGRVRGTDLYTDDSSICTAAVHRGLIKLQQGGKVTVEKRPGMPLYLGSDRNGIMSSSYDNRPSNFPGSERGRDAPTRGKRWHLAQPGSTKMRDRGALGWAARIGARRGRTGWWPGRSRRGPERSGRVRPDGRSARAKRRIQAQVRWK